MLGLRLFWWLSWLRICLQCGKPGFDPWVGKIPWRRELLHTPVFWPREFCGLCSPWAQKEWDMTEWLTFNLTWLSAEACGIFHCGLCSPECGLSSCSIWATYPTICGLLFSRQGVEPVLPALAGRFLTTGPPGRSPMKILFKVIENILKLWDDWITP